MTYLNPALRIASNMKKARLKGHFGRSTAIGSQQKIPVNREKELMRANPSAQHALRPGLANKAMVAVSLLIILSIFFAYRDVLDAGFVIDDDVYITNNPRIGQGFTPGNILWAFRTFHAANWHPLTWLSLMLDTQIFGTSATGYHATNVLFHALTSVLVFIVLCRMTAAFWRSACVAGLFALHPIHVESVAWIAERKDVLSAFLFMLALAAYISSVAKPRALRSATVITLFAFGLMAKSMLVTFPFLLLVLDWWPLKRPWGWRLLKEKIPLFALTFGSCLVTILAQTRGGAVHSSDYTAGLRMANAFSSYLGYLEKTFLPTGLAAFYPYPWAPPVWWKTALTLIALSAVTAVAVSFRREKPYLLTGWLWYLGMLVPVIGLVQVGSQAMADRYMYLPLVGVSIAVVWAAADFTTKLSLARRAIPTAAVAALVACLALTRTQVGYWKDVRSLFNHALAVTADNWQAHSFLGSVDLSEGKIAEAGDHFHAALRIAPSSANVHVNSGLFETARGNPSGALEHYKTALMLEPENQAAHVNLAVTLAGMRRPDEAMLHYQRALQLDPEKVVVHMNIGNLLSDLGRDGESLEWYALALRIDPRNAMVWFNRGVSLERLVRFREAAESYRAALKVKPDYLAAGTALKRLEGRW